MHTYLAASLPLCLLGQTPPMSAEQYRFQCSGVLSSEDLHELDLLIKDPLPECRTLFGQTWSALMRQMRFELAALRAKQWATKPPVPERSFGFSQEVQRLVQEATSRESPLDMEWTLDQGRWALLQSLIPPANPLGLERILAFGVQLTLMQRWMTIAENKGQEGLTAVIQSNISKAFT